MNRDRILEIADDIEANGTSRPTFDMSSFFEFDGDKWLNKEDWCHTSACIAGYVCTLKLPNFNQHSDHGFDAARWLGLKPTEAYDLFCTSGSVTGSDIHFGNITAEMAVVCLRHFAVTGTVDWAFAIAACEQKETISFEDFLAEGRALL